jgi:hypothetical protein
VAAPPIEAVPVVQAAPPTTPVVAQAPGKPVQAPSKPAQAAAAPPAKPKKPKEVYYNIVGDPVSTDDE